MGCNWIVCCLIVLISITSHHVEAQVKRLSPSEGLSQSYVNTILIDKSGYLWVSTEAGLNRYDGYQIVPINGPDGELEEANKQDQIWVAYFNYQIVAACRLQNKSEFLFLSTVYVAPAHRGKGVAKALLSTLLKAANKQVYTFAYKHLVDLYCFIGFNEVLTYTPALQVLFDLYQHRNIVALEYR